MKPMRLETYISEGINDKAILKSIFLAGNSGAGKSYVLSRIKSGNIDARIVNTDKIFEWQGNQNVAKAKLLTVNQLQLYVDSMLPLVIDGTSTNASTTLKRKAILETLGYRTGMVFINCSLETSLERARIRGEKTGRIVPPEIVTRAYEAMAKVKPVYRSAFEFIVEIDNDIGELSDEVILNGFRKTIGFFNGPYSPKGQEIINRMKDMGWKYLSDGVYDLAFIQQVCDNWYDVKAGHSI